MSLFSALPSAGFPYLVKCKVTDVLPALGFLDSSAGLGFVYIWREVLSETSNKQGLLMRLDKEM